MSKPDPAGAWDPCCLPDGQTLGWGSLRIPEGPIKMLDVRTRQLSVDTSSTAAL